MASLNEALVEAMRRRRPCAILSTVYKGFLVEDITEDVLEGNVAFILGDNVNNGAPIVPQNPNAEASLAVLFYKAIGVGDKVPDSVPKFLLDEKIPSKEVNKVLKKRAKKIKRLTKKK